MRFPNFGSALVFLVLTVATAVAWNVRPSGAAEATVVSKTQQILDSSASQKKYTFLVFYRDNTPTLQAMGQTVKDVVTKRAGDASMAYVSVASPNEQALIQKFGVNRAPLPLTLAVAPNGAIMGVFSQKVSEAQLVDSFATPVMMHCMKAMQESKLVMVCVQAKPGSDLPPAVKDFRADPDFKSRTAVITTTTLDAAEDDFFKQMQINPETHQGTTTVFFAPPGVLIGKFDHAATKAQMITALHKAGKCCDDPNCKHGQANSPSAANNRAATPIRK